LEAFIRISLGIESIDFKRMALNYLGRWNLVQLRCSNFMTCSLQERLALALLELSEDFGIADNDGLRLNLLTRHSDLAGFGGSFGAADHAASEPVRARSLHCTKGSPADCAT
jgi:hypothetical protein